MISTLRKRDLFRVIVTTYAPLAVVLGLILTAIASYEARYTDASGAKCIEFVIGSHEFDLCHNGTE